MVKKQDQPVSGQVYAPPVYPMKTKTRITVLFVVMVGLLIYSSQRTEVTFSSLATGIPNMVQVFVKFFPPDFDIMDAVIKRLAETIQMAVIATTFAALLCVPLSLLAARNIMPNRWVYFTVRTFLNILRTIPDIVLAVIFVGLFGIGALSGILALIIFSLGILAKLISETIEAVDMKPIEAMRASGANSMQTICFGLVPQVLPQFFSFVLYVLEINIRASVVLGLVGAGGIGLLLDQQIKFYNYPQAMAIIIVIFAAVVIIEFISTKIREAIV